MILFLRNLKKYERFANVEPIEKRDVSYFSIIYFNTRNSLGIDRCVVKCGGNCVEYGLTGNAFCFPKPSHEEASPRYRKPPNDKGEYEDNSDNDTNQDIVDEVEEDEEEDDNEQDDEEDGNEQDDNIDDK